MLLDPNVFQVGRTNARRRRHDALGHCLAPGVNAEDGDQDERQQETHRRASLVWTAEGGCPYMGRGDHLHMRYRLELWL